MFKQLVLRNIACRLKAYITIDRFKVSGIPVVVVGAGVVVGARVVVVGLDVGVVRVVTVVPTVVSTVKSICNLCVNFIQKYILNITRITIICMRIIAAFMHMCTYRGTNFTWFHTQLHLDVGNSD